MWSQELPGSGAQTASTPLIMTILKWDINSGPDAQSQWVWELLPLGTGRSIGMGNLSKSIGALMTGGNKSRLLSWIQFNVEPRNWRLLRRRIVQQVIGPVWSSGWIRKIVDVHPTSGWTPPLVGVSAETYVHVHPKRSGTLIAVAASANSWPSKETHTVLI